MAQYPSYYNYNPYTTQYGTIAGIRGLKESIRGLTQDYLARKQQESAMAQAIAQQEFQTKQAEMTHALALRQAEIGEAEKTRQAEFQARQQTERERTQAATRETALMQKELAKTRIESLGIESERERQLNEIVSKEEMLGDIKAVPLRFRQAEEAMRASLPPTGRRRDYMDVLKQRAISIGKSLPVTALKQKENLYKKFETELTKYTPTATKPGFPPDSEPILNFAKRLNEAFGGEYEVVPVKWVEEYQPIREAEPGSQFAEARKAMGVQGEPITSFQELTPMELILFREGKYIPEKGMKYGYIIQPIRTDVETRPRSVSDILGIKPALPSKSALQPTQTDIMTKPRGVSEALKITPTTRKPTPDQTIDMLEQAGIFPIPREDYRDIMLGKINIQDYINTYRKQ